MMSNSPISDYKLLCKANFKLRIISAYHFMKDDCAFMLTMSTNKVKRQSLRIANEVSYFQQLLSLDKRV
jgi:hypothetical protein